MIAQLAAPRAETPPGGLYADVLFSQGCPSALMPVQFHSGKHLVMLVCCLLHVWTTAHGASEKEKAADALLARARDLTDIRAEGGPAFHLRARVRLVNVPNGPVEGFYSEFRDSQGQWRNVLEMPDWKYISVEIGKGGRVFRAGNARYMPYFEFRLRGLLSLFRRFKIPRGGGTSIAQRRISGQPVTCLSSKKKGAKNEFCFDLALGLLVRGQSRSGEFNWTYEYLNYLPFGDKQFPRLLRLKEQKRVFLEAEIEKLTTDIDLSAPLFTPPYNAEDWVECDDPTPAEALEKPEPRYPREARRARERGKVLVYIVVGTDGRVYNATPVRAEALSLAKSTLDTISRRWRFKPAACGGKPLPMATFVEAFFNVINWDKINENFKKAKG